jgi:rfaE bifunctional protein nucleotidyltransferase chain/domain
MRTYYKVIEDLIQFVQLVDGARGVCRKKIVFTNGCFDVFHMGHVHLLEKAKGLGGKDGILIVAVNSDESVKKIKGDKRPIVPQDQRAHVVASLQCVDIVTIFNEETPYNLIWHIKPDVLVKGGDWNSQNIVGSDIVRSNGGEVHVVDIELETSSTKIINTILDKYKEK